MQRRGRTGFTIVEMMIVIAIVAILSTVLLNAFITGTRTTVQTSAQNDVQSMGRIALERFIDDVRGGFAVVTTVTDPDTGRVYHTTNAGDDLSTAEDDRFTIVFAVPAIGSASGSNPEVIFDGSQQVAAYDAVIWRVLRVDRSSSEGVGWKASDYRWYLVRTVLPAVWRIAGVTVSGSSVTAGSNTYFLGRQRQNVGDNWQALSPASTDLMLDVSQAAHLVVFKDSNGAAIGGSPAAVTAGLPAANVGLPPADRSAYVTALTLPKNAGGAVMPVTDVALMDMNLTLLRREAHVWDAAQSNNQGDNRAVLQMLSATDVKLRNKRDWN